MPQGDRTGPRGEGPLTGRGLGNCGPRGGYYGRSQGIGFGRGRGFGFHANYAYDNYDPLTFHRILVSARKKKLLTQL